MPEFELTIRCSKDIKRITVDFDGSSSSTMDFSVPQGEPDEPARTPQRADPFERLLNVAPKATAQKGPVAATASAPLPVPDVEGRPPRVDEGFNESL